ncbi:autophagy-related protein 17 [Rhodocollybia butyracea]|uniref:Autophagy-related protein 17 n=1 Tax=Rhodocollybia butyracea TaxID=206335 RepID=A0A9P5PDN3_9AGAR|nr:autophagy-related protein 17 [Rhodocollybia butyracea]
MSSPPASDPHIVSLVLQSKKALQNGEQLCLKANELSTASAQASIDVLILDSKVRWITDNVLEQLKLASSVAKSIEEKRAKLNRQVQDWDNMRTKHTNALDKILDELGSQRVPPDFHQTSAASSIFGSQDSDDENGPKQSNGHFTLSQSPSDTIQVPKPKLQTDRSNWKTLRDFVDDQAIEDIFEDMEEQRMVVEDSIIRTDEYPEKLIAAIDSIRDYLPEAISPPPIEQLITSQDSAKVGMASHLESLAAHYDQMVNAMRESEAGDAFSEDDLQDMNRDTEELPSILAELEENLASVIAIREQLSQIRDNNQEHLKRLSNVLDELDELGDIMMEMLQTQETVESECEDRFSEMQRHLLTIEDLHQRFISYQTAFQKLILEIARRRVYKEAAENIVRGMMDQLIAMTEEERQVREHFNNEHGAHLPEDLCLCISNVPTKWEILPWNGEVLETLPEIPSDMLPTKDQIHRTEPVAPVNCTESL